MRRLEVRLAMDGDARPVGTLAQRGPLAYFEYDPAFLDAGLELSPFHLPLRPGVFEAPASPFGGVHGVFGDSLPDGWGLLLMDRAFRARGVSREDVTALDRLSYIGTRAIGALTYHPSTGPEHNDRIPLDLAELAAEAERLLEGSAEDVLPQLLRAGGSPGGARPKVLVGFRERDGAMISGSDALPAGYVGYLVKFAALADDAEAGAVEHAYARMAAAAGIDVPPTRLFTASDGRRYFAAERFDRQRGMRRHVHTLAGLLHADYRLPALDYEGYLKATLVLTKDHSAVREAFRRMVFNVLAHNRDDHTKNFAFVMDTDGTWRLTPAYDLTFSSGPGGEHTMAVAGEGRSPGSRHFTELAEKMSIAAAAAAEIVSEVEAAVADWPRFADEAGVAVAKTRVIEERLREVRGRALAQPSTASRRGGRTGRARRG